MTKNISPSLEDYLESLYVQGKRGRPVRPRDLVVSMEVRASSVVEALNHLKNRGLVMHQPYQAVELTPRGLRLAKVVYKKHQTLKKFFQRVLLLHEDTAEKDACQIEHYLSRATVNRILQFIRFLEAPSGEMPRALAQFELFINDKVTRKMQGKRKAI